MAASSSRGPISSSFYSPYPSSSSSSSFKQIPPQSATSAGYGGSGNGYGYRSDSVGVDSSHSMYSRGGYGGRSPVGYQSADEMIDEVMDEAPRSGGGDSISVTIQLKREARD